MKTSIRRLDSLTHNDTAATKLINDNFEALQQGVEDALSRSGKKPNFMDDVLDMNMHRIINIADPVDDYDLANKHYVDTKVAEEETRAKNAEATEEAARIAGDNALQRAVDDEEAARIAGDNTLQGLIDDEKTARINSDNELRAAISALGSQAIYTRSATYLGTGTAEIDVSDIVEDGVAYVPIVTTAVNASDKEARKTLNSICWYHKSQKIVQLLFTDNSYQRANNIQYSVTLIPTTQAYTGDGTKGITDGLDNLCGSGGESIYLKNQTIIFGAGYGSMYVSVADVVETGVAYYPVVYVHGIEKNISVMVEYDVTDKRVWVSRHDTTSSQTITVDICLTPTSSTETMIQGISNGMYQNAFVFVDKSDIVTSISSSSTNKQVPSAKCVYDALSQTIGGNAICITNQTFTFTNTSVEARLSVSSYVEEGKAYLPIVLVIGTFDYQAIGLSIYDKTRKDVTLARSIAASASGTLNVTADVYLIPVDSSSSLVTGICNDLGTMAQYFVAQTAIKTSLSSASTDSQVPSAKCVYDELADKVNIVGTDDITIKKSDAGVKFQKADGTPVAEVKGSVSGANSGIVDIDVHKQTSGSSAFARFQIAYNSQGAYSLAFWGRNTDSGDTNVCLSSATTSTTNTDLACKGWINNYFVSKLAISTSLSSSSTDDEVPSAKCVYDMIGDIETLLAAI